MGVGIAAGPHCRCRWYSGLPAPERTRDLPPSCALRCLSLRTVFLWPASPPVRPAWQALPFCSAFSSAAAAVRDHVGLAVAGARTAFVALPRFLPLRACFLLSSWTPLPLARPRNLAVGRSPQVGKRALPRVLACCPSLRFCWRLHPVFQPSALPLPPCFGTPFRHPEPVFPVCNSLAPKRASAR